VPLDWAVTQNGLADALKLLGKREGDAARLQEAVAVYNAAIAAYAAFGLDYNVAVCSGSRDEANALLSQRH
jgi:hypothetical protein